MSAWGTELFDNDTSNDLLYEIIEAGDDAKTFIQSLINVELNDDEEFGLLWAYEYIASGAILDALLHGNTYEYQAEGFEEWLQAQSLNSIIEFLPAVLRGLKHVLSENSELNELWQETEDYPEWRSNIEKLITSLER